MNVKLKANTTNKTNYLKAIYDEFSEKDIDAQETLDKITDEAYHTFITEDMPEDEMFDKENTLVSAFVNLEYAAFCYGFREALKLIRETE